MEQYPSPVAAAELKQHEKHATEALKDAAKKIAIKKALWRRYQWTMSPNQSMTDTEILTNVVKVWRLWMTDQRERKVKKQIDETQYESMMDQWWQKHLQVQEYVRHKKQMDEVLKLNQSRWGPPMFPKSNSSGVRFWLGQPVHAGRKRPTSSLMPPSSQHRSLHDCSSGSARCDSASISACRQPSAS
eukprot:CAMPEP_0169390528 /NCGR_PEP_ID=MMETSP1017-20121227/47421_1 /TAXON_ID=342587 /ORGANISM="Karlodinium micrum, Strain CCMP2283" /LENGTH=186 /DNA_ID=CAMNT_0009492983 /DNA_START=132 /DNA_END=689 /DNA_ORIENTATION=-